MSDIEIFAVILNILGVWLTARRTRWCWPVSVLAVLLYAWIFYQAKLYSDTLLQGIFALLQVYGWWRWSQGGLTHGKVRVARLPLNEGLYGLLGGVLGAAILGAVMYRFTDAAVPWLDASLTAFSLVASVWAARKYVVSWWLWIVLDCLYVGLFLFKDLQLTAALYAGFVLLAVYGLRSWQQDLARQELEPDADDNVFATGSTAGEPIR